MKTLKIVSLVFRFIAALIMFQTLYFKFSGAEESVYIFSTLHMEPWGRIGTGIAELIASVLLITPTFCWLGALMGIGIMSGAIVSHLTVLGIEVKGDGGYLFFLCLTVFVSCCIVFFINRHQVTVIKSFFSSGKSLTV